MKFDLILSGLSGQGIQTLAAIISEAAKRCAIHVSQPHLPRQSQRDGAVAHLRFSNVPPDSDSALRRGEGDLLIGLEPLECLGYADFLRREASVLTATEPVRNIPNYPDIEVILEMIRCLPHSSLIDAAWIASEECMPEAANIVMLGAAAHLLPLPEEQLRVVLAEWFEARAGESEAVLRLFDAGKAAARNEHLVDEFASA